MNISRNTERYLIIALIPALLCSCSLFGGDDDSTGKSIIAQPLHSEEELINSALEAYADGLYSVAKTSFTDLINGYPSSYWTTQAQLKLAECHYQLKDYPQAIQEYDKFINQHPTHEAVPYARHQIALCHVLQYRSGQKDQTPLHVAIAKFEELIKLYPDSPYAISARRFIARSRELLAEYDLRVVEFYEKQEMKDAAYFRLLHIVDDYPETDSALTARSKLVKDYGQKNDISRSGLGKPKADKATIKIPETPILLQ